MSPSRLLPILGLLAIAGCETTAGFGRDMQRAGSALQNESNEVQYRNRVRREQTDGPTDREPIQSAPIQEPTS